MGSILNPNRVIANDVESCTYCSYVVRCATLILWVGRMPQPQTDATHYHEKLGPPDKSCAIKGFVVCNDWDLETLDVLYGLSLGCYPPSPEVWYVCLPVQHFEICLIFANFLRIYNFFLQKWYLSIHFRRKYFLYFLFLKERKLSVFILKSMKNNHICTL